MNFPTKEDEIAYLEDCANFYQSKADELMKKTQFKIADVNRVQLYTSIADSAKELAEELKNEA